MITNDIYHIDERVRELYPGMWLEGVPGSYRVKSKRAVLVRCGPHFGYTADQTYTVMTWPEWTLDGRLLTQMRYGDSWNNQRDILRELEEADYERERAEEKRRAEIADDAAKRIAKVMHDNPL